MVKLLKAGFGLHGLGGLPLFIPSNGTIKRIELRLYALPNSRTHLDGINILVVSRLFCQRFEISESTRQSLDVRFPEAIYGI